MYLHLNNLLRDFWPELIYDEVELLERVGLKLRLILFGQKSEKSSCTRERERDGPSASISKGG